ncbi:aromatic-ring hydroxylase C-terminal domain-containing protein [Nocardia sp. R16R-3T]
MLESRRIVGIAVGVLRAPRWISHCGGAARQADRHRVGRIFLGGDLPAGSEWHERIEIVAAMSTGPIPGVGEIATPSAVLPRPDGHVAWASAEPDAAGLPEALTIWVGAPA